MKRRNVHIALVLSLYITISLSTPAFAGEGTAGDYLGEIGTKFGRGLWNIVSSPAEVPCAIVSETDENPKSGFFPGLGKGTLFMLRRMIIGVTEVVTFVIPMERSIPPVCHEEI